MGERGEITELEPSRVIAWTWGGELFRFELSPDGEGCVLVFVHVFDDRALGAQHAAGWEVYLNRLDAHLAGGFLSEEAAHEAAPELHERYAERFGLDPEVGRRMFAAQAGSERRRSPASASYRPTPRQASCSSARKLSGFVPSSSASSRAMRCTATVSGKTERCSPRLRSETR